MTVSRPTPARTRSAMLVALAAAVLVGCELAGGGLIVVPTQPPAPPGPVGCPAALAQGTLVADARWGVALGTEEGRVVKVVWPNGFAARDEPDGRVLLDSMRRVVGRTGQRVEIGGGFTAEDAEFLACGGITVIT